MDGYKPMVVVFDEQMLKEFSGFDKKNPDEYFKHHPRSKKPPFESIWGKSRDGLAPSWNTFLNCPSRQIQATWKKHYGEYARYCFNKQRVKHPYIDKYLVLAIQFKPRATKSDNDNTMVKPILDMMVEEEVVVDDNYTNMMYFGSFSVVDRGEPRTEIRLYPIDDEYDFVVAIMALTNDVIELYDKYEEVFFAK